MMMPPGVSNPQVEVALAAAAELGEGPVWDPVAARLIWVDIGGRTVHFYNPATGQAESVRVPGMPGVAIPRRSGGLVLAIDHGFSFLRDDGTLEAVVSVPQGPVVARMNDGNCDSAGRLWAGTMGLHEEPGAGSLYRLDPDGTVTRVLDSVTISNGIDWSPDDRLMYYVDSAQHQVDVFDFDSATGAVEHRRPFAAIGGGGIVPDGLTVDGEGFIWVACWGGASVIRLSPDGHPERTVLLPATNVTSCAFGGHALEDLYITTAREGLGRTALRHEPDAGALFVHRPGVRGRSQHAFGG